MIIVRVLLGRGIAAKTTLATTALPNFAANTTSLGTANTEGTAVNLRNMSKTSVEHSKDYSFSTDV